MTTPLRQSPMSPLATPSTTGSAPADGVEVIMPNQYSDRRTEARQMRDDSGALLFLSSHQVITCRILDSSPSGARVAMEAVTDIPSEIWLIDTDSQTVKRGTAAWSMANRMGLKFNFMQKMVLGGPCPPKVPSEVFDAWLRLTNTSDPKAAKPENRATTSCISTKTQPDIQSVYGVAKRVSTRDTERSVLKYVNTVSQRDDGLQTARALLE